MLKYSYIVDTGMAAFRAAKFNSNVIQEQELFCKCGGRHKYTQKVIRDILLSDASLYQSDYDFDSITCPYCNETYNIKNKIRVLEPNLGLLNEVSFYLHKQVLSNGDKILRLVKERIYALYSDSTRTVSEKKIYDELNINLSTKEINIFIDNSLFVDLGSKTLMQESKDNTGGIFSYLDKNHSNKISFSTLNRLGKFFCFNSIYVIYNNLQTAFEFLKEISEHLIDFHKIKNSSVTYISVFWDNYKIYLENKDEKNIEKIKRYIYVEDEFSLENTKEKQSLEPGVYIMMLESLSNIIFSLHVFPNIITVFTTKNYLFFQDFIKSDVISNPNVFNYHNATYPNRIFEICANYNKIGSVRILNDKQTKLKIEEVKLLDFTKFVKISSLIYQNINNVEDILCIKLFSEKNYLTKLQIEQLFQKYPEESIYKVFGFLGKSETISELTYRHIEHIIRYKLYESVSDFLVIYRDTVRILHKIVDTQSKVVEHIRKSKNLSKEEKDALSVYLTIKENKIFEIKNSKDLHKLHDNLSILYSVFQDADKVEKYVKAIEKHTNLNIEIDFYDFIVIPSAFELQKEHMIMNHCINTYIDRIIGETYLAIRIVDRISNEHSTLGLRISEKSIIFDQLKSYSNSLSSSYLIMAVMKFFKKFNIDTLGGNFNDLSLSEGRSTRETRKDVYPIEKSNNLRIKLLQKREKDIKNEINPEEYNKLIEEFHQLFIEVNKNNN